MYVDIGDDSVRQGDVIKNFVFAYYSLVDEPHFFDGNGDELAIDLNDDDFEIPAGASLLGTPVKTFAIVISQTCDIEHREYICLARILPLAQRVRGFSEKTPRNQVKTICRELAGGRQPALFYLQESPEHGLPKSLAHLCEIQTVRRLDLGFLRANRVLRLGDEGLKDLQFRLANFSGRYAAREGYMLTPEEMDVWQRDAADRA